MCQELACPTLSRPLREIAREDLRFVLESVQLDRPASARAVALKLRCLADDALLAGNPAIHARAVHAAATADRWHAGVDAENARVGVLRAVIDISRALLITLY